MVLDVARSSDKEQSVGCTGLKFGVHRPRVCVQAYLDSCKIRVKEWCRGDAAAHVLCSSERCIKQVQSDAIAQAVVQHMTPVHSAAVSVDVRGGTKLTSSEQYLVSAELRGSNAFFLH